MRLSVLHIVLKGLRFYRKQYFYQFLIITFLAAVITASLLTGSSVRRSLLNQNLEKLNGTSFVISSGNRFIPVSFMEALRPENNISAEGILELGGWAKNFSTGVSALDVKVVAVENSFFDFDGISNELSLNSGEAAVNRKLADKIGVSVGDDIILRVSSQSELPADSPFAPEKDPYESYVLTVTHILEGVNEENFSLGINQVKPLNIFLPLSEFQGLFDGEKKINRVIIKDNPDLSYIKVAEALEKVFTPLHAGLTVREVPKSKKTEIISERVFISEDELQEIQEELPAARPVLTYLANSFRLGSRHTPYSFITGISPGINKEVPAENEILISRWLADDLKADIGDTVYVDYFVAGSFKSFIEKTSAFVVSGFFDTESDITDPELMPEFPGISGSESCSRWDAGAPIDLDLIREKDEDYWYDYNGTPKAFINYNTALSIWGNQFGPATAIRFTDRISKDQLIESLKGKIDPFKSGFSLINIKENSLNAARNSVDFTSLFLGLGFFIILSAIILLSLVVTSQMETRYGQLKTLKSIGFENSRINSVLFMEAIFPALAGTVAGIFVGAILDNIIISALNTVWKGAVQTDTLSSYQDIGSFLLGFASSFIIILISLRLQISQLLKKAYIKDIQPRKGFIIKNIRTLFLVSLIVSLAALAASLAMGTGETGIWFLSGTMSLITLILLILLFLKLISESTKEDYISPGKSSWKYFGRYPSRAISPVIFLAAGLFVVIITGANRKSFNRSDISKDGGTGGYLLWGETASPLLFDLNSTKGRYEYNLDEESLKAWSFVQAKKVSGDDASCLNLNQVESPPLLGLNSTVFADEKRFSFVEKIDDKYDPWAMLNSLPEENTIYGIADQTVLQWSLFREVGDTIKLAAESGEELNIVIAGGLAASVFQGHIIISTENLKIYYPSVSGSSVFLATGDPGQMEDNLALLRERFEPYGIDLDYSSARLESFYEVTNTYLDVFLTLGGIGMVLGVIGMGFVLLRNFTFRKKEYALMMAEGYSLASIRSVILKEHLLILSAGILLAVISAPLATLPSLLGTGSVPIVMISIMILLVYLVGFGAILISLRNLPGNSLVSILRKE
ncbi:MAG: FtsX-like permease family protein [Marinilabiliaceae bacterium]|jgi:ABC-type antimicrobial peptide transport system permease subunit|nr:FtsX-like permease family protein [Marinilabiliaceae bacterium]